MDFFGIGVIPVGYVTFCQLQAVRPRFFSISQLPLLRLLDELPDELRPLDELRLRDGEDTVPRPELVEDRLRTVVRLREFVLRELSESIVRLRVRL